MIRTSCGIVFGLVLVAATSLGQVPELAKKSPNVSSKDQAKSWMDEVGLRQGYDQKTETFTAIGTATIGVSHDHPAFGNARLVAYEEAMMRCRVALAGFIAAQISTNLETSATRPARIRKTVLDFKKLN